jgi:hypothetical protein
MAMFSPKSGSFRCVIPIEAQYSRKYGRIEVWVDHKKVAQFTNTDGCCVMYQATPGQHFIEVVTVDTAVTPQVVTKENVTVTIV